MKRLLVLMLGLAAVSSTSVWAGQGKGPRTFEALDTNSDKALSKEEVAVAPRLNSNFDLVDTDKNGSISKEELQAFRAERRAARMNK